MKMGAAFQVEHRQRNATMRQTGKPQSYQPLWQVSDVSDAGLFYHEIFNPRLIAD